MGSLDINTNVIDTTIKVKRGTPEYKIKMAEIVRRNREKKHSKVNEQPNTNLIDNVVNGDVVPNSDINGFNSELLANNGELDSFDGRNILQEYKKFQDKALPKINSLTLKSLRILEQQLENVKEGDIKSISQLFSILFDRGKESGTARNTNVTSKTYIFNVNK